MSKTFDLEARRVARSEKRVDGDFHEVTFAGRVWPFPVEMPLTFIESLLRGRVATAMKYLLGEDPGAQFLEQVNPTREDLEELAVELYGINMGEARASTDSSTSTGSSSRPTSNGTTA